MVSRYPIIATVALVVAPALAQDRFEMPLTSPSRPAAGRMTVSIGSTGLNTKAGSADWQEREQAYRAFNIPSERPPASAPGFTVKIPLGSTSK